MRSKHVGKFVEIRSGVICTKTVTFLYIGSSAWSISSNK